MSARLELMVIFSPDAIELHGELVTTWFLWATRLEIVSEPQQFDVGSHNALPKFLDVVDRFHSFNPQLAVTYADVLLNCINVKYGLVIERPGSEQVARAASICLLRALSCVDWTVMVDKGTFGRYTSTIPPDVIFGRLLCRHTMGAIHALFANHKGWWLDWTNNKSRSPEYVLFANALDYVVRARASRACLKVSRWVLRFVLHSLSQDLSHHRLSINHRDRPRV